MALLGTGTNSNLVLPDSDDHYAELEDAAKSNQPNRAVYHLVTIVKELQERVAELEGKVNSKPAAKKASSRKVSKGADTKKSDSDKTDSDSSED